MSSFCKFIVCVFIVLANLGSAFAQQDNFVGNWLIESTVANSNTKIKFQLAIAPAEQGVLYPANLFIQCDSFAGVYELLLVKKNTRELAISKNKYPLSEKGLTLKNTLYYFNGILDYSRDVKGQPILQMSGITQKLAASMLPDTALLSTVDKNTALQLFYFLKAGNIVLSKQSSTGIKNIDGGSIISPSISKAYYGIMDTVHVQTRDGKYTINSSKKNDLVTAYANNKLLFEQLPLTKKAIKEECLLDTGLNTIVLFADEFINGQPCAAALQLELGNKKVVLDFNKKQDSGASFIVCRIYHDKDKENDIRFEEYTPTSNANTNTLANKKVMGSLVSHSQQLQLAIWDDAVEDGDSVSININGQWIAKGLPVKKKPQFITVPLKPGDNAIVFVADNLGSISPNTSVIEIIDGKKRKSFMLETILGENNVINIMYNTATIK